MGWLGFVFSTAQRSLRAQWVCTLSQYGGHSSSVLPCLCVGLILDTAWQANTCRIMRPPGGEEGDRWYCARAHTLDAVGDSVGGSAVAPEHGRRGVSGFAD